MVLQSAAATTGELRVSAADVGEEGAHDSAGWMSRRNARRPGADPPRPDHAVRRLWKDRQGVESQSALEPQTKNQHMPSRSTTLISHVTWGKKF
jgi:hypothetical protein